MSLLALPGRYRFLLANGHYCFQCASQMFAIRGNEHSGEEKDGTAGQATELRKRYRGMSVVQNGPGSTPERKKRRRVTQKQRFLGTHRGYLTIAPNTVLPVGVHSY